MMLLKKIKDDRGMVLFIALMLVIMMSIVGIGIIKSSNDEVAIAGNEMQEMKAFYAAQAGLDKAVAELQSKYEAEWRIPDTLPAGSLTVEGITIRYSTAIDTNEQKTVTKGSLAGLKGFITPYRIYSHAYHNIHNTSISLEETFEVAVVPIFQFSVFYEEDLEIAPGPSMILLGRIHTNGNAHLQSEAQININSYFTSFGNIYHGRKPGSGLTDTDGEVDIMGLDGNYYSMRDGMSGWLDANDSYWFDSALHRWGGRVQDAGFGQEKLLMPIDDSDHPHTIIERDTSGGTGDSFENQATFKIMDSLALFHNGTSWVNVTDSLLADGSLKQTTFFDKRENQNVTVYDIDMSKFNVSPFFPTNGIIYTGDNRSGLRGTRIYNAAEVGFPLTIASENPVYTFGDVNTISKKPMAIIADGLTVLSTNWDDDPAKAASDDKTVRMAKNTAVNLCYITGNEDTGGGQYNGGLENLPRFLEDWSHRTLAYRGSMICLWNSQELSGVWNGTYYTPPGRDWGFDTDLNDPANMPPGTPMVRGFTRMGWRQSNVGYVQGHAAVE